MATTFDRSIYMSFIPEYLRDNEDFLVFLQLAATEFDISFENIESYTDLVNPDKVPMKFIEALGSFVDYKFVENADDDFNRELLMRMHSIYEQRGTDHAIIMAATHGDNIGYVGGDIFIPGYPISKDMATLVVARDNVFTHSRSRHSSGDVFADGDTYMPGVIIIQLPYLNEDILEKIIEVMPAGVRFKFFANTTLYDPDSDSEYGALSVHKFFRVVPLTDEEKASQNSDIDFRLLIEPIVKQDNVDILIHSTRVPGRPLRSGRMLIQEDNEVISFLGVSMLAHNFLTKGFLKETSSSSPEIPIPEEIVTSRLFKRSTSSARFSSIFRSSGELIGIPDPTEEDTTYILSPSGEKLDIKEKTGSAHVNRNIAQNSDVTLDVQVDYRITAERSKNTGIRSGRGKMSGIITGVIDAYVPIMEITPHDFLYPAYMVRNLRPKQCRNPFYNPPFEIDVGGEPDPIDFTVKPDIALDLESGSMFGIDYPDNIDIELDVIKPEDDPMYGSLIFSGKYTGNLRSGPYHPRTYHEESLIFSGTYKGNKRSGPSIE